MTFSFTNIHVYWQLAVLLSAFLGATFSQSVSVSVSPITSENGTRTTLTCTYSVNEPGYTVDGVRWYKDTFTGSGIASILVAGSSPLYADGYSEPAYMLTRNDVSGTTNFIIAEVRLDKDDGIYGCQVDYVDASLDITSERDSAMLTVISPPDTPVISGNDTMSENVATTLTCTADLGYPDDWYLVWSNEGAAVEDPSGTTAVLSGTSQRYMFTSQLEFTPKRQDNTHIIKCSASRPSWTSTPIPEQTLGPINVQYETNITNKHQTEAGIRSDLTANLSCTAKGNPVPDITWFDPSNAEIIHGGNDNKYMVEVSYTTSDTDMTIGNVTTSKLTIRAVDGQVDYGVYTCNSINGVGLPDSHTIILNGTTVTPSLDLDFTLLYNSIDGTVIIEGLTDSGGCILLEVKYEGINDWRPCGDCITTDNKVVLILWCLRATTRRQRATVDVEDVRARFCKQDGQICSYSFNVKRAKISTTVPSSAAVIAGVTVGVVSLGVVVFLLGIVVGRKIKNKNNEVPGELNLTAQGKQRCAVDKRLPTDELFVYQDMAFVESSDPGKKPNTTHANMATKDKAFPRDMLNIVKELGHGAFGQVFLAEANGIIERSEITLVAIKTLKVGASESDKGDAMRELGLMKKLPDHCNVVKLLGFSVEQDPPYIIVEYLSRGDLKELLKDSRSKGGCVYGNLHGVSKSLTSGNLVKFANDVADGMQFISSHKCIHRDLAARNVLVAEDMICKVSDFGLARDVTDTRVYERRSEGRLPLRWMSIESIIDDVYTTESDVWSFGVLLWEIVTLGSRPYPSMSAKTMIVELQAGYRMPKPNHCQEELYQMMLKCWKEDPKSRPNFKKIRNELCTLGRQGKELISIRGFDEAVYEVTVPKSEQEKA